MPREIPDEEAAFAQVAERLTERFPQIPSARIGDAVREAQSQFSAARVRDFVPRLVERELRARLEHSS